MNSDINRRQVLLFLLAIILPCSVLVTLGLRMMSQERELAEKRLAEDQHRRLSEVRQELLARLERIKLQEVSSLTTQARAAQAGSYQNPAVVLVACPGWLILAHGMRSMAAACCTSRKKSLGPNTEPASAVP